MGTQRASLVPRDTELLKKEIQLRVIPTELKFLNARAGRVYRLPVVVHNLGRSNHKIRFQGPFKPQFKLVSTNQDKELASGLQLTVIVEYHPDKNEDIFDQLILSVGNKTIEIPLMGLIPSCQLEIEPVVDFGTLVANRKVYSKEVNIINCGKAPGHFKTDYQGQLPIVFFPTHGTVDSQSSMVLKMDFCADHPRTVNETATIHVEGHPDIHLNIKARVVEQIIELLSIDDETSLNCVRFGSLFFGTSKIEQILLYNNSPGPINWVAIMQDDSVGEEMGTNIQQRTDVVLHNLTCLQKSNNVDVTTFISCIPNDGHLLPYEKTVITFCFSPKMTPDVKMNFDPAHRQDYVVFLRFESVGSKEGFLRDDNESIKGDRFRKVELALTGTGLPVLLYFKPARGLRFAPCFMGEHSENRFLMQNQSKLLPVRYRFKKAAYFQLYPQKGRLDEGCIQNVLCTFVPYHVGVFHVKQTVQLIGPVADENFLSTSLKPFLEIDLNFNSVCKPFNPKVVMELTPGISPVISNPAGKFVISDPTKCKDYTRVAMLRSKKTNIHDHCYGDQSVEDALIAFPNDRVASIRPGNQYEHFRTIFTKIPRYNYVDPEYAYTESEKMKKTENKNYYAKYIKDSRDARLQKQAHRKHVSSDNDSDTRLQRASGLMSPVPSLSEINEDSSSDSPCKSQLLSTRTISSKETECLGKKVLHELKSHPSTVNEKQDCSLILTPKQIHQVVVGPTVLNFGNVCVNSTNTRLLHVINMLPVHIIIQLDVNLEELRKTDQFSYVIPPTSSTYISVLFESPTVGKFWKSFTFTVNNIPGGHILVMAVVHPVKLELSTNELVLKPHGFMVKTRFRGTVTLYNRQNYFVQFTWEPVSTARGMAFSICPVKGTVDPFSSLICEVIWHPSFSAPEAGEFILHVDEGNTMTLKCAAHLGHTKVLLLESRIHFSNSPQGLTSWKNAVLRNVGQNHAYFKVCDQSLLSMIDITPSEGIVPLGGLTILNISCIPTKAENFETKTKVVIRRANIIDLRIGGLVEIADVEIKPHFFNFNGTFVGTTRIIPFLVTNKGMARARVEFNLEEFKHFSMDFKDKSVQYSDPEFPDIFYFELEGNSSLECGMTFSPLEVTTFHFTFQVQINFFKASELYTERCLSKTLSAPKTTPLIRPCEVQATVLQAPLELSCTEFIFELPVHCMDAKDEVPKSQDLVIHNTSERNVEWILDHSGYSELFKNGTFNISIVAGVLGPHEKCNVSISFYPSHPRKYTADILMYLSKYPVCYRVLHLIGEVKLPKLSFEPPFIFFTPVPLGVATMVDINIVPQNYFRNSGIHVRIPTATLFDGEEIHPLAVTFPSGMNIKASPNGINVALPCHLVFKSCKPVSLFSNILFSDDTNNWFSLPVIATSENCILTLYPYMALNLDKQKVVLKNGMEILYERSILTSGKSEKEDHESTKKEEENKQFTSLQEGTKVYNFFEKVVNSVQTWFSLFGWPDGPHSLTIPESVRRDVYKMRFDSTSSFTKWSRENDFSKYNKTIYDVILHLSGKSLPGINPSQFLPVDNNERVTQLRLQHSLLLEFLIAQGACISHVLPEFLLEPEDYKTWIEITYSSKTVSERPVEDPSVVVNMTNFEDWSKRSWTDVFLQIYKVLVLSRVVPLSRSNLPPACVQNSPKINPSFISSNIYSPSERTLLSWMNTNYENARHIIWKNCDKGPIPEERWIVNFDQDLSDGLVFATQLGAYCPFLIETHFINMYTQLKRPEHYLHNSLIIVNVLREIGFDMDIQASDICEPNPVMMLMLSVYMYERLPTYLPKKVVHFQCTLYETKLGRIILKNPSVKTLVYNVTLVGRDAVDFSLVRTGNIVTISPQKEIEITVKYRSRFLRPSEASLLLISKPKHTIGGATVTFALKGEVLNFKAIETIKCRSPCYSWKGITVDLINPFKVAGDFNIMLVESSTFITLPSELARPQQLIDDKYTDAPVRGSKRDIAEGCYRTPNTLKTSIQSEFIREFFCNKSIFKVGAKGSKLQIFYLPFGLHLRYCVIILSNRKIGELIYIIEGRGTIPLPSSFLKMQVPSPVEFFRLQHKENTESPVVYLQCNPCEVLNVELRLPLTNEAKEKALAFAAQKQMSKIEYERRLITGTLESSSVRVAIALLGLTKIESCLLFHSSRMKKPKSIVYTTKLSLPEYFIAPKNISFPHISEIQAKYDQPQEIRPLKKTVEDDSVAFPLTFSPLTPGYYPCTILLTSRYDVRVFQVEGVVNNLAPEAKFEFNTPAFQAVTQCIPIHNPSDKEWKCLAVIDGDGFYGPPVFYVEPGETKQYPLSFKPILECKIKGKFSLRIEHDGTIHSFEIIGIGRKPVPLEHITVHCKLGSITDKTLMVPNYTKNRIIYKVTSDLPIVWGEPALLIGPDNTVPYTLHICPWTSGVIEGSVSFFVKTREEESQDDLNLIFKKASTLPRNSGSSLFYKYDKDIKVGAFNKLKIWFHLKIHSSPGPPVKVIEMRCRALENSCIEIPLFNPKDKTIHINVKFSNASLTGLKKVELCPQKNIIYNVQYCPAATGLRDESVVFQPDICLEFWYLLRLTTELPKPTIMPEVQCELGKCVTETITLVNPTCETLEVKGKSSIPETFILDMNEPLTVAPFSSEEVTVRFCPSGLGRSGHQASIIFYCTQFEEWKFCVSGVGLYPVPLDMERMSTYLHLHASTVIPFQNPTTEDVLVDIRLTSQEMPSHITIDRFWSSFCHDTCAFKFSSLSQTQGIILPPKGKVAIPVLFVPHTMKLYKTMVVVEMMRTNGEAWPIDNFDDLNTEVKRIMGVDTGEIQSICWMYPIIGLPQATVLKSPHAVIECQAKRRIEQDVEITLTGDFSGKNPIVEVTDFLVIPKRTPDEIYENIIDYPMKREFEYELLFEPEAVKSKMGSCIALYVVKKSYCPKTKKITLVFHVIFAPRKPIRTQITLQIECITDGIWSFPILFIATVPGVDDVINIEGIGLFKDSIVEFKMTSQKRESEPFTAFFLPGSDPEFFVEPESGILLPYNTDGTPIRVAFRPQMYSKKYKATLAIQTADMYWSYHINGIPEVTIQPISAKPKVDTVNKKVIDKHIHHHNFIRENTKITRTGASSPIKGETLMMKKK